MVDFLMISTRSKRRGTIEIYPKFIIKKSSDLMIRGGDFYAVWIEDRGLWSTEEQDVIKIVDYELDKYASEHFQDSDFEIKVLHMWDAESGMIDNWHKYCQRQMRDNFHMLDETIIFSNTPVNKKDYASKRLNYPLEEGSITAYNELMSVLYSEEERHKIEWAIGAIVSGDSKDIQKFMVLYGASGTGKSTVIDIIQLLFDGYCTTFESKALGTSSNVFALEAFRSNPLVAVEHDGDLSRIEDNTRINSLVSHEVMTVNEKFKSTYSNQFKCFLILGTNKPVKITDAKSGLIRRLIDVSPTGNLIPQKRYLKLKKQVKFELGAIAYHCREVYLNDPNRYDDYVPIAMLSATNDFYNYILEYYPIFKDENATTLKSAWEMYKTYCDEAKVSYPFSQRIFKEELKNYFYEYKERATLDGGLRVRNYYLGFKQDKFQNDVIKAKTEEPIDSWLELKTYISIFDEECADCPAQYATLNQDRQAVPKQRWAEVKTKLADLDTSKVHYVKPPSNYIVIDFDIPDENGEKSLERNLEEAEKWPPTYAEISQSGKALHLHYIYTGDVSKLSRVYADHIEIKVFTGKSSLRRKLTECNDLPIAEISSGLPLKGENKVVNYEGIKSEKQLRTLIKKNLNKEYHPATTPSIDFIKKILDDAYDQGLKYDVSDMYNAIFSFAAAATNQSDRCIKTVGQMKFKSKDLIDDIPGKDERLVFFDVEVFPNLFLVNWKYEGKDNKVVRMINPTSADIEGLIKFKLIGFNCRRYDNHILYGRLIGYDNRQLYELSKKIIQGKSGCFFANAYNLSYTDVYDFSKEKKSLKRFEIELGIHHKELGLPWDEPVPEDRWEEVAKYCDNDVIATEAVFHDRKYDFVAREILADVAGMTVNDTTNSLTTRIIFGNDKHPQEHFNYRNMGDVPCDENGAIVTEDRVLYMPYNDRFTVFDEKRRPLFPTYIFDKGKSIYRGEEVGEGGYVYSEPGMYGNVALEDIASQHPSSIIAERLFGIYTDRFDELVQARIAIKHKDFDKARTMLDGKLKKYLTDEDAANNLAGALKIAINSVYGLTAAKFDNAFRDIRNVDNIVAKRGALFMINLRHAVQERGFKVAHIKTDSIKIPDATPEILQFVRDYGKEYGYTFEHEATYDRMCLINDAVYVAKTKDGKWTATGAQFKVPYVFKTLFSKEPIEFKDLCETKAVTSSLYLDMNENLPEGEHDYRFVGKVGSFCPIKPGKGGGTLLREKDGKYYAVQGTKGYRWLESEVVQTLDKEDDIDKSYWNKLVTDAIDAISEQGDYEWFVSDEPYAGLCVPLKELPPEDEDLPF